MGKRSFRFIFSMKMIDKGCTLLYNMTCVAGETPDFYRAGCGSAWLERLVWDQEAAGSNPVTPMNYAGVVQW